MALTIRLENGDPRRQSFRAEIKPNRSMSARNLVVSVICLTVVCLTIALSFFSLGLWLVLPFAGLEIFVVGIVVGYTIRRSEDYEIIQIDDKNVVVTQRQGRAVQEKKFSRYWTRVRLQAGTTPLQPSRLEIGSHGKFIEVGRDLTQDSRQELTTRLNQVLRKAVYSLKYKSCME